MCLCGAVENSMDSSFDLFLPNKISKKALVSAKSKDFKKVDDLERAISLSLQETNSSNSSINLAGFKGKNRKICSAPLLLRRTKADREKIISEKVALVLASSNESVERERFSQSEASVKLKSGSLNDCLDSEASLWKLSQLTSLEDATTEPFMLSIISQYEENGSQLTRDSSGTASNSEIMVDTPSLMNSLGDTEVNSDASTEPPYDMDVEDKDPFPCGTQFVVRPNPKMEGGSPCTVSQVNTEINSDASTEPPIDLDVGDDDPIPCGTQERNVSGFDVVRANSGTKHTSPCGMRSQINIEINSAESTEPPDDLDVEDDVRHSNKNVMSRGSPLFCGLGSLGSGSGRRKRKFEDFSGGNEDSSSVELIEDRINRTHQRNELVSDESDLELRLSSNDESTSCKSSKPSCNRVFDSSNNEWSPSYEAMVLKRLSEDLKGLIHVTDSYVVHIYLKGDFKFKAQSNMLKVRCPLLFKDAKSRMLLWPEIELTTCRAFFTYLYAGSLDEIRNLSSEELDQVDHLSAKYEVELLRKFVKSINPTCPVDNSELEVINTSVTNLSPCGSASPDMFNDPWAVDPGHPSTSYYHGSTNEIVCISSPANTPDRSPPKAISNSSDDDSFDHARSQLVQTETVVSPVVKDCQTPQGQRIVSSKATPMPIYTALLTPELKRELDKYGLKKGLSRNKAITLLNYIYEQIHPDKRDPIVRKAIIETQGIRQRANEADSESEASSDSTASVSDKETEEVTAMTADDKELVLREIGNFIKENDELHLSVLKYESVRLEKLSASLKEKSIRHSKPVLKYALNELGIDYITEESTKKSARRRQKMRKH